jgi:hypothetical protein
VTEFDDLALNPPSEGDHGPLTKAMLAAARERIEREPIAAWTGPAPIGWEQIAQLYDQIEAGNRAREARWRAQWRGRLDGATLTEVMRLWDHGELPFGVHLAVGTPMRERIRQQLTIQGQLPQGSAFVPAGLAGRHLNVDIVIDEGLGDRWELRAGRPGPDGSGEAIAAGTRLA